MGFASTEGGSVNRVRNPGPGSRSGTQITVGVAENFTGLALLIQQSAYGVGTTVTVALPKAVPPNGHKRVTGGNTPTGRDT
jgi:hypothetical protein